MKAIMHPIQCRQFLYRLFTAEVSNTLLPGNRLLRSKKYPKSLIFILKIDNASNG